MRNVKNDRDVQIKLSVNNGADVCYYAMANFVVEDLFAFRPFEGLVQIHSELLLKARIQVDGLGYPGSPAKKDRDVFDENMVNRFCMGAMPRKFYEKPNWTNMLGCTDVDGEISEEMMEAVRDSVESNELLNVPKFVALRDSQLDLALFQTIEEAPDNFRLGFRNSSQDRRIAAAFASLDKCFLCVPEALASKAQGYFDSKRGQLMDDFAADRQKGGRPRIQEDAALEYQQLFPEGHTKFGLSWKQAVAQLSEHVGHEKYKLDTIQRGLGLKK